MPNNNAVFANVLSYLHNRNELNRAGFDRVITKKINGAFCATVYNCPQTKNMYIMCDT